MADGRIKIAIEVDGKQVNVAADSLDGLGSSAKNAGKWSKDVADGLKDVGEKSNKADTGIKKIATSLGLVAVASSAFKVLAASMDDAIKRFDTLNKFPKVLQSLGVSAEDSERAISNLSDGIDGLPTKLDDIASTAQRMYTSFGDMDKATDSALALNNALLASGSSGAEAASGTEQYIQALQKGKPDMMEWRNMQQNMSIALDRVAEQYGITTDELGAALRSGEISMDSFNDKIIELGTGTGELAELAKTNSVGLATSLSNLKNAASRGIADILESLNKLSKDATGKEIAQHIDSLKVVINAAFKAMGNAIESATPYVKGFMSAAEDLIPVVKALTPAIAGVVAAYTAYTVIDKARTAIEKSNAILKVAQASKTGLTLVTKAHTAALATDLGMTQAQTTATVAQTGAVKLSALAIGVMTGEIGLLTAAKTIATAVTYGLKVALDVLTGPIGLVITGIGLLVTGGVALVKWLKKETEESKRLTEETEKLAEATDGLVDTVTSSSKAYEDSQKEAIAQSEANRLLAEEITNLTEKENKSAAEKMILKDKIEQLNGEVTDLNLSYSEEADALNMSNEQLQGKVDLMAEQTSYNEALQRQVEIAKEQHEVAMQLEETNALREEWNQKLEDGSVKAGEHKDAIADLDEQEQVLKETTAELAEQQKITEEQMTASMEAITEATEAGVSNQIIAFDDLSESQQSTVESMKSTWEDYKSAATDMFDTLNDEIEITASEMASNLEENQRVISEWSENIATLAERGVDEGLLETLREAGPESAGHVNALVNASDEELAHLSEVFAQGGDVATDALSKSLGIEESGVMDAVGHLVSDIESSLKSEIESAGFDQLGIDVTDGFAGGVEEGTPDVEKATKDMADSAIDTTKDTLAIQSPSKVFEEIGASTTDGMTLGVSNGTSKVISTMKKLATDMLKPFQNIESDFNAIGRDAMAGLNRGLNNRRGRIMSTARSIASSVASTMRRALDTHSPSRVTMKIGEDTGQGLADGIENKQKDVNEASEKMAESVASIMESNIKAMNAAIKSATEKHNVEIAQLEKRHKEDVQSIRLKASEDKRALTRDEKIRIERMTEDHNQKILEMETKAAEERARIAEDSAKELIAIGERYVAERKWQGEMSIKEEGHFWNQMYRALKVGTEEYESALKNHQDVVKRFRSEMEKTNEDYSKRMTDIDKNLANETKRVGDNYTNTSKNIRETLAKDIEKVQSDFEKASADIRKQLEGDIERVNNQYENSYNNRVSELTNVTGLFERYFKSTRVPEGHLFRSLESQVKALEEYSDVMGSLNDRIDNQDLLNELQALGPDSLAELEALNRLSDDKLAEYVDLYEKRFKLASEQASKELEPMKDETQKQIQELNRIAERELNQLQVQTQAQIRELRRIANKELEQLKIETESQIKELNETAQTELDAMEKEWVNAINDIVLGTEEEFDSMYQVGVDAVKGLEDGMLAEESSLMSTAKRIADSVSRTIKSALDINSPSRLMRDEIGKMIPAGIALGIKENADLIDKEMLGLSRMMTSTPEQALGVSRMRYNGSSGVTHASTISNDHSRSYNPQIVNNFTPAESTPSESARKQKQQQQRLAMEWGIS